MPANPYERDCPSRELLDRIGDHWTVLIVGALRAGPLRFTEVGRRVEGISQKALTQTLRTLVRDGILTRTAYAVIPPKVEYALTPLGHDLAEPLGLLDHWARHHLAQVTAARATFDAGRVDPGR